MEKCTIASTEVVDTGPKPYGVVTLEAKDGRTFSMHVPDVSVAVLKEAMLGTILPKPDPYRLLVSVLKSTGFNISGLEIRKDVVASHFNAIINVYKPKGDEEFEVKRFICKPSDGLVLCVLSGADILASEDTFEA